jgi:hypothetical protein
VDGPVINKKQFTVESIIQFILELMLEMHQTKESADLLGIALNLVSKHFNITFQPDQFRTLSTPS